MRKSVVMFLSTLLLSAVSFAQAPAAKPQITDFIGERSVIAGELDLTRIDPPAIENWVLDMMKQAGMIAPAAPKGITEAEFHQGFAEMKRWVDDFKKNGGTKIFLIGGGDQLDRFGPAIFAPTADDNNAKALASLLFSGKVGGPTRYENMNDPRNQFPRAEVIPGKGAAWGSGNAVAYIKSITPAARPDFAAAVKSAGDAPARLVVAPDPKFRAFMQKNMPPQIMGRPSTLLSQDITWAAASASPPPAAQGKLVVQAKDAPSATSLSEMLTGVLNMWKVMQQGQGAQNVDAAMAAVTPKVQGDQLVLTLDNNAFAMVAKQMTIPFLQSRQTALRVRSASNMRQLLQTCMMYSNEHKGAWPEDFKGLEEAAKKFASGPNAAAIFTNPARPEMTPAYVYVKPDTAMGPNAGEQLVMYEAHKDFGEGVNVGFADGHVEFVMNQNRFNDLLAKAAAQPGK